MDTFLSQQELTEKYGSDIAVIIDRAKHELQYISLNGERSIPVSFNIASLDCALKPQYLPCDFQTLSRKQALQNLIKFSIKDSEPRALDISHLYELKSKVIKNFIKFHYHVLGDAYFIND